MFAPALFLILIVANITEAITGFGSTVIALTLGAFLFPIQELIVVLVPLNLVLSLMIVAQSARQIDWRILLRDILPLTALGMVAGLALQKSFQQSIGLQKGYGAFVFIFALVQLAKSRAAAPSPKQPTRLVKAGLLLGGGLMQGIYASGGPLVVSYVSQILKDKNTFRATLSFLWVLLNGLLFLIYVSDGLYTSEVQTFALKHSPAVIIGMLIGNFLHRRIQERFFRRLVFLLLMTAGLALLVR